uniref:Putative secreted protein n=1 Tax=Ixodes ricinus TaxID=34613 RepID=A0A6B0TSF1_IXORI
MLLFRRSSTAICLSFCSCVVSTSSILLSDAKRISSMLQLNTASGRWLNLLNEMLSSLMLERTLISIGRSDS